MTNRKNSGTRARKATPAAQAPAPNPLKGIVPSIFTLEEVDALDVDVSGESFKYALFVATGLDMETGNFSDSALVTVLADSPAAAVKKASVGVRRNWYYIRECDMTGSWRRDAHD